MATTPVELANIIRHLPVLEEPTDPEEANRELLEKISALLQMTEGTPKGVRRKLPEDEKDSGAYFFGNSDGVHYSCWREMAGESSILKISITDAHSIGLPFYRVACALLGEPVLNYEHPPNTSNYIFVWPWKQVEIKLLPEE